MPFQFQVERELFLKAEGQGQFFAKKDRWLLIKPITRNSNILSGC